MLWNFELTYLHTIVTTSLISLFLDAIVVKTELKILIVNKQHDSNAYNSEFRIKV